MTKNKQTAEKYFFQGTCVMAYSIKPGLYVGTSTSFFDVIHECFQVFFHLVFVRRMLVEKKLNGHVPVVNGCNCHISLHYMMVIIGYVLP